MLKELTKTFLIYGVASSIGKFIGLIFVPIYTRIFSPEQYGIVDLISTVVALVSIMGMMQLESAISRYYFAVKEDEQRRIYISTAFWTIIAFSCFWAVIVFLLANPVSILLFKTDQYRSVIIVASLIIPFSNIFSFLTVLMRFIKKPVIFTIFVTIQLLSTVGVSVWLVVFERIGIIGVLYGQLSGYVLAAGAMLFYLKFLLRFVWNWDVLKKFFRYSLPMVPAVCGGWLNTYVGRFVMLGYLTVADIGLYTVALKIASIFGLVESAFGMAWGPFMWENFERPDHRDIYKRIMKIVCIGVFSLVVAVALFGREILLMLATQAYAKSAPLIGVLSFSLGLRIVNTTVGLGAGICKRTEYNTLIMFIGVGVNIAFLFILVPTIGLIGVPLCMLISSTVLIILGWYISERLYYIGFSKIFFGVGYIITLIIVGISIVPSLNLVHKMAIMMVWCFLIATIFLIGKVHVLQVKRRR
jgi:O-antigen/teichoic acid export membrane protein